MRPSFVTTIKRGLTRRCPACGEGRIFRSFLRLRRSCPACGWVVEREPGAVTGAMYLVAILSIPSLYLFNVVIFFDSVPPDMGWLVVMPVLIFGQIWVVIAEEFGWRGFALPRLQRRFGSLGATLILGPSWALWHLPMFFVAGSPQYSDDVPVSLAIYTVIIFFTSIIFTMVYNRSGSSVLACMLLHASFNIAAFTIQLPPNVNITAYLIIALGIVSIWFLDRPLFGISR